MNIWWQRRSVYVRLGGWSAAAGAAVLTLCLLGARVLGIWQPVAHRDAIWMFAVELPAATLLFAIVGYFLGRRALAPVKAMVDQTRRFSPNSLSERVPVTNPHDELGQLATVVNETFQQHEDSVAELRRFAADASHELRTPLTAMRAVGEVALREPNQVILYDAVVSMLEEIRRMNQLIERLLLLARVDNDDIPVDLEAGPVRSALLEVSDALGLVAEEKQQRIQVDCERDVVAEFDAGLLRLALMNLAQNAIRYSPPDTDIILRGFRTDGATAIEVIDEGPGIAAEHHERIFERFYRVDKARSRAAGGAGLGLAIVKWSVERMDGTVELQSEVGRGSVFRVRLPSRPAE